MSKPGVIPPFTKYKGHLNEYTYQAAFNEEPPPSPFRPRDCYLVCKVLKERCAIPGFTIEGTPDYVKDREVDAVVLASGPGYRIRGGAHPYTYDGKRVLNQCKRGDLVRFLERAGHPVRWGGEDYILIEEHKLYFAVDND